MPMSSVLFSAGRSIAAVASVHSARRVHALATKSSSDASVVFTRMVNGKYHHQPVIVTRFHAYDSKPARSTCRMPKKPSKNCGAGTYGKRQERPTLKP